MSNTPVAEKSAPCRSPGCVSTSGVGVSGFCSSCREVLSERILELQVEFGRPIKKVLVDLVKMFPRADAMAGAIGVSQVTLYAWIRDHFDGLSFDDFRRQHVCGKMNCLILSTEEMAISEKYYVIGKLRTAGVCSCPVGRQAAKSLVLANCSMRRLEEIFPGIDDPSSTAAPKILGRKNRDGEVS